MVADRHHRAYQLPSIDRVAVVRYIFWFFAAVMIVRLGVLQILQHASVVEVIDQRQKLQSVLPQRGEISILNEHGTQEVPIAFAQTIATIFAVPEEITQDKKEEIAKQISEILTLDTNETVEKLSRTGTQFVPLARRVLPEVVDRIEQNQWKGIYFDRTPGRVTVDGTLMGQIAGFVRADESRLTGQYGIEEYYNKELSGHSGWEHLLRDGNGRLIPLPGGTSEKAQDGLNIVLTIDRSIQYQTCMALQRGVEAHQAVGGSAIVINPQTGEIRALCNVPSFDPNNYASVKNPRDYNNATIVDAYEPGSVMKVFTMAGGLEHALVTTETTFVDSGSVTFGPHTIHNAANKTYGQQSMVGVLKESINTGAVFVAQKLGKDLFKEFIEGMKFGVATGVELPYEHAGNLRSLNENGFIYTATASFGQGITVTVLQLAQALSAIANGGTLISPTIIKEFRTPSGLVLSRPIQKRTTVMSATTSTLIGGMMVQVVEEGHSKGAAVPGYYIAGKTGTAQIAAQGARGYSGAYNHTFIGFGPIENPKFTIVVRIVNPKALYAESTAVPVAGEIEKFLISYDRIPPTRTIGQ